MSKWIETYRGVVNPWECDVVEHFTIAYYYDRLADATRNFFDLIEESGGPGSGPSASSASHATFQQELRAGAGFHILTAVTGIDAGELRLGHQVVDSTSGKTVAWIAERHPLLKASNAATNQKLASLSIPWPGPKVRNARAPTAARGMLTARDRVKPMEIGEDGTMSLSSQVHRFSAAGMQVLAAVGMTVTYMQQQRRGFSTFELNMTRVGDARIGDIVDVTTSVFHVGNSSLRFNHRMTGPNEREIAFLVQSGVHLDMDARRSTAIPDELRALISKLLVRGP